MDSLSRAWNSSGPAIVTASAREGDGGTICGEVAQSRREWPPPPSPIGGAPRRRCAVAPGQAGFQRGPQQSHTVTVPGRTTGNCHGNRQARIGLPDLARADRDGYDGRDGSFLKFRWASAPRFRPSLPPAKDLPGRSAGNRHNRHHRHGSGEVQSLPTGNPGLLTFRRDKKTGAPREEGGAALPGGTELV